MTDINWRGIAFWMFIVGLLIVGLSVAVVHAEPANATSIAYSNGSYIIETLEGPVTVFSGDLATENITVSSRYISQGDIVYLGDTLDISGVVPPYPQLAYWNGYDLYDTAPTYNITLPQQKSGWYNFTIDPAIFATRLGKWYKYADTFERQGNNLAFIVLPRPFYNYTLTFQNGTMIYVSELPDFERALPIPTPTPELMPRKHVADYLITSDDSFNITISNTSAVWIFDKQDNSIIYSVNDTPSRILVNSTKITPLEPGDYKIIIQSVGNMSRNFDVILSDGMIKWFDRSLFEVKVISTENLVPSEAIRTLEAIFPLTYDNYQIRKLTIEDPAITIGYMSEVGVSSAKEYYRDPDKRGNVSLMDVRGYTNVLPGTNVSVTLDEAGRTMREVSKLYTYPGKAQGTFLGDMRYYQVYVPLYWNDLKPGMHNLTARTELGGYAVANFPVNETHPDSYIPPQTIRFMGDRNPWVPTPTPEIIIQKETVVVTQQIPVTIAPSDAQIREEARKMVEEQNQRNVMMGIGGVVGLIVLMGVVWFGYSVWRVRKE